MKKPLIIALLGFVSVTTLSAGAINVVHAGPKDVMKFEVTAGDATMDFTLAHGSDSGSFVLPDKKATIKGFLKGIPELEVPPSKNPRFAILAPSGTGYAWHLLDGKPSEDEWTFRIVNLSTDPANVNSANGLIEIPAGGEKALEVSAKAQISFKMPDTVDFSYDGSEPCGVVAFVYRDDDEWKAFFLPDR